MSEVFNKYFEIVKRSEPIKTTGKVIKVKGILIESEGPIGALGDICEIHTVEKTIRAEIAGFEGKKVLLMPIETPLGIAPEDLVINTGKKLEIPVGWELLGRVLNGLGEPIDGKGKIIPDTFYPIDNDPPPPLERKSISEPIQTGVKAIDGILTVGKGQRMGIFSGSGVGKTTLLSMIARNTSADVNVIALVGERGREVKEFIEKNLGEDGLKKSVVVVATSDEPPMMRLRAAYTATTIAEYFRDQGKDVMLLFDSLTRFAFAQREIGLALGEPPSSRGYTPSVFTLLPRLLERTGNSKNGSITAFYTVLVEGDDITEPISDHVRATLDGHIWLSRDLASRAHYPAIDILQSVSRLMPDIVTKEHLELAMKLKELVAVYKDAEDLINIGAYIKGNNPKIDEALEKIDKINRFLKQDPYEKWSFQQTVEALKNIFQKT